MRLGSSSSARLASELDVKAEASGPSWARSDWPPQQADDLTAALTGEWARCSQSKIKAATQKISEKAARRASVFRMTQ